MAKPRLLDLFCGAGGASVGYARAGFEVVGVDLHPQKNYPFEFIQADAMTFPLEGFDAIHASPPCQDHTTLKSRIEAHGTGWMLGETIRRLQSCGTPFVVENVMGAKAQMPNAIKLCGSSFGLLVQRHRLFLSNLMLLSPGCTHSIWANNSFPSLNKSGREGGKVSRVVGVYGSSGGKMPKLWKEAMGIDWMTTKELAQSIPPAYTEYLGGFLMKSVKHG